MNMLRLFTFSLALLCSACSITKNISNQPPYDQCIGKKFVLKEDMYIFKFHGSSQYSIAPQNSGITGLPRYVDKKYLEDDHFGKNNHYLTMKGIVPKGSIFNITRVVRIKTFEMSYVMFLIAFDDIPAIKNGIITTEMLNFDNPPDALNWSDPPIFKAKFVEPLPSDGVWWK